MGNTIAPPKLVPVMSASDQLATGETGAPTIPAAAAVQVAAMAEELACASGERLVVAERLRRQDEQIEELKRSNHAILQELLALRRQLTTDDERSVVARAATDSDAES